MALSLPPDPTPLSEPPVHPRGAPMELDVAGDTTCSASAERIRPGQDSLDPLEHFQGGLRGAESATSAPRFPTPFSYEDTAGGRHYEHLISGCEQQSGEYAYLTWIEAWDLGYQPSGMVQLQVGGREAKMWVFEETDRPDQDMEADGDSDGLVGLTTPAELEWDPAGDLGLLSQKAAWTPGTPCELCGHRSSQVRGQDLEHKNMQASLSPQDVIQKVDLGTPAQESTWPLIFFLFLFLLCAILLLAGGLCSFHTRLTRTPYLVLSYVNGAPPT
ncbi:PREDICTED: nesprin-4 [Chrysochloris asiatica]|uniref:Nesprin-4 n=1 Tax=Chrysochloris asiatica TaxID=185453 RepID=A0A9B0TVJ0_CHRAS|nr:PREDICTED: nesprin-4 [Chrysochloris asiatica]